MVVAVVVTGDVVASVVTPTDAGITGTVAVMANVVSAKMPVTRSAAVVAGFGDVILTRFDFTYSSHHVGNSTFCGAILI